MAPDQAAPIPAGWYPDPYGASELRWWDGQSWTESIHPPVVAAPAPGAPAPPAQPEPEPTPEPEPAPAPNPEPVPVPEPTPAPIPTPAPEPQPVPEPQPTPQPVQAPIPAPELIVPPAPAPASPQEAPALPSRRELRERATGPSEGPLSATTSSPQPDTAVPTAFDWVKDGGGASADAPQAPAEPVAPPASAQVPADQNPFETGSIGTGPAASVSADTGPFAATASGSVPISASSAWAQEPRSSATTPDTLYPTASARKSTVSGWLIATMPLMTGILVIAAVKGGENYPRYVPPGIEWWMLAGIVVAALYVATIILAITDRRKLDWSGFNRPAHWAWAVLTAPVYLLVRTIAVKRETGRNSMLLWVWLILAAVVVGAWFAATYFAPELVSGYTLPFL